MPNQSRFPGLAPLNSKLNLPFPPTVSAATILRRLLPFLPHSQVKGLTFYCKGAHVRHSATLSGAVGGWLILTRIIPSDVEQKLRVPALASTGVATTTY